MMQLKVSNHMFLRVGGEIKVRKDTLILVFTFFLINSLYLMIKKNK